MPPKKCKADKPAKATTIQSQSQQSTPMTQIDAPSTGASPRRIMKSCYALISPKLQDVQTAACGYKNTYISVFNVT